MSGRTRAGRGGRGGRGNGRGRCRSKAAAASSAANRACNKWAVLGARVEVRSDEDGFIGAWFAAEVVHLESRHSCVVEYEQLLVDDGSSALQEIVLLDNVRPLPPALPACRSWLQGDQVEAYDRDGWWAGLVVDSSPDSDLVQVHFRITGEVLCLHSSLLRGLQSWENGKWTDLTQVGRPVNDLAGDAGDTNGSLIPLHIDNMTKRGRSRERDGSISINEASEAMDADQLDDGDEVPQPPLAKHQKPCKNVNGLEIYNMENHYLQPSQSVSPQKSKVRLELVAYQLLVESLRLKGPFTWEHERLLSDVRLHLHITNEEQALVVKGLMPPEDRRR